MAERFAIAFDRGLDVSTPGHEAPPGTFRAVAGLVPIATTTGVSWQAPEGAAPLPEAPPGVLSLGLRPVPGAEDEILALTADALLRLSAESGAALGTPLFAFASPDATRRATVATVGTSSVVAVTRGEGLGVPEVLLVVDAAGAARPLGLPSPLPPTVSVSAPPADAPEGRRGLVRGAYGLRVAYALGGGAFGPMSHPVAVHVAVPSTSGRGYVQVGFPGLGLGPGSLAASLGQQGVTGVAVFLTPPLASMQDALSATWHHVGTVALPSVAPGVLPELPPEPSLSLTMDSDEIGTRAAAADDSLSHRTPRAGAVTSYNGRLVVGDTVLRYEAPTPDALRWQGGARAVRIGLEMTLSTGPVRLVSPPGTGGASLVGPLGVDDPRATALVVYVEAAPGSGAWREGLRLPLRSATTSATAWAIPASEADPAWAVPATLPPGFEHPAMPGGLAGHHDEHVPARVLVSELYAPSLLHARRAVRLGQGADEHVVAFASNAQPLSTGQFGEYPLLALCASSVWAGFSGEGDVAFASWEPLALRVGCVGRRAHALVESRVAFAAPQGVYLVENGALVGPITAPLVRARAEDDLLDALGPDTALAYLEDRARGRRELWLSAGRLTFAYGLDAAAWTLLERERRAFVRSEDGRVLGLGTHGRLFDERGDASVETDVYVATAPLHLGAVGAFKRLRSLAVRQGRPLSSLVWKLYDRDPVTGSPVLAAYGDLSDRADAGKLYALCREPVVVLVGRARPGQSVEGVVLDADVRLTHRAPSLPDVQDFEDVLWTPTHGFGGRLFVEGEDEASVTVTGEGAYAMREGPTETVRFLGVDYEVTPVTLTPGLLARERMTDETAHDTRLAVDEAPADIP